MDKKEKRKFDFLSTSNFNKIPPPPPGSKNNINVVIPSNKDTLDSLKKTANPKENIQRRPKLRSSKESEKSSLIITPNLCNFQKFEFTLKNHRQFVQTLVWILNFVRENHQTENDFHIKSKQNLKNISLHYDYCKKLDFCICIKDF